MKNVMTPNITLAIVLVAAIAAVALRTPSSPGRPASAAEQVQDIFHELHPDGRNAVCTVCESQYRLA